MAKPSFSQNVRPVAGGEQVAVPLVAELVGDEAARPVLRLRPLRVQDAVVELRGGGHVFHAAEDVFRGDDLIVLAPGVADAGLPGIDVDRVRRHAEAAASSLDRVRVDPVIDRDVVPVLADDGVVAGRRAHQVRRGGVLEAPVPDDTVAGRVDRDQAPVRERLLTTRHRDVELPRLLVVRIVVGRNPVPGVVGLALRPEVVHAVDEIRAAAGSHALVGDGHLGRVSHFERGRQQDRHRVTVVVARQRPARGGRDLADLHRLRVQHQRSHRRLQRGEADGRRAYDRVAIPIEANVRRLVHEIEGPLPLGVWLPRRQRTPRDQRPLLELRRALLDRQRVLRQRVRQHAPLLPGSAVRPLALLPSRRRASRERREPADPNDHPSTLEPHCPPLCRFTRPDAPARHARPSPSPSPVYPNISLSSRPTTDSAARLLPSSERTSSSNAR